MQNVIRWGIVGAGGIARRFAEACPRAGGASLVAIASRSQEKADRFGDEFGIPRRFGSYEDMAAFDGIDAAYIATPHAVHTPCAILMLNHGKAVLSEKPIAVNLAELDKMIAAAKANRKLLVEAMWARMVPGTLKLLELVAGGVIGRVRGIAATFSYDMRDEPEHHAFDPRYGGGSLLDVGCYALHFASWFAGAPVAEIRALAEIGEVSKVDEQCAVLLRCENNTLATLNSGMTFRRPGTGTLFGEDGVIAMDRFYAPERFTLRLYEDEAHPREFETPYLGNGFEEQIAAFGRCLREGRQESDLVPFAQSREIARQMDEIRRQVGVVYPQDLVG